MNNTSSGIAGGQNGATQLLADVLASGIQLLGLTVAAQSQQQLLGYVTLLGKWNQTYNLSAIRDPQQMLVRHVLDSLSIAPLLQGHYFVDVGSGAGLPGVPLAICFPERHFVLLDSNGKKTRFLTQVKHDLDLANVTVVQGRVEAYQPEQPIDGVLSRAFAGLDAMLTSSRHLLPTAGSGRFYAMKGKLPAAELETLAEGYRVERCVPLHVPGLDGERHVIIIATQS